MSTIANISAATLQYAPLALGSVASIESAAATYPGETKLQLAANLTMASAVIGQASGVPQVQEVSALCSLLVGILNATGVFSHGPKVAVKPVGVLPKVAADTASSVSAAAIYHPRA